MIGQIPSTEFADVLLQATIAVLGGRQRYCCGTHIAISSALAVWFTGYRLDLA